ncbi:MAG: lysylphosphatidylglycerol synthase transmembrane domain-containing protein [Solirubrobacteraceae bacterium]
MRLAEARRSQRAERPWGGERLTSVLCLLAFVAVANAVGGGLRVVDADDRHSASRLVVDLAISFLLSAWALARVRVQWAQDAARPTANHPRERASKDTEATHLSKRCAWWLRCARWSVMLAVLALAAVIIASQFGTVETAFAQLKHLHWRTLRWAIYAEALALVAFAQLTRLLLRAGGVNLRLGSMIVLTLASNAVAITLPGGPAWAVTFSFDQLRRRGVRKSLTASALTVSWVMSAVALLLIALVGIDLAGSSGPAAPFRVIATALTTAVGLAALAGGLLVRQPRFRAAASRGVQRLCASARWSRAGQLVHAGAHELHGAQPRARVVLRCIAAAVLNWVFDCACLVFSLLAVGGHVPWQGVLAAYGLTQIAAALPITPGGIGVVEGTLSVLLIAYHMPAATAIAGVMLYRVISFWILVPVGWGAVGALAAMHRRSRADGLWMPRVTPVRPFTSTSAAVTATATGGPSPPLVAGGGPPIRDLADRSGHVFMRPAHTCDTQRGLQDVVHLADP